MSMKVSYNNARCLPDSRVYHLASKYWGVEIVFFLSPTPFPKKWGLAVVLDIQESVY
jgi:hypothetical protein